MINSYYNADIQYQGLSVKISLNKKSFCINLLSNKYLHDFQTTQ